MGEQGAKRHNDSWKGIGVTIVILAIATGIGAMFTEANILIVYVLGVMITAVITASRMWSVLSSLCSVLLFNFLYTEPRFSLTAYDSGYPITFVIAFLAAIIASNLAIQLRKQADGLSHKNSSGDESDTAEGRKRRRNHTRGGRTDCEIDREKCRVL